MSPSQLDKTRAFLYLKRNEGLKPALLNADKLPAKQMNGNLPLKIKEITEKNYGPILIIIAVSFAVYINTLFNGYVYDDFSVILENELIRDFRNIKRFIFADVWVFDEAHKTSNYYRPFYNIVLTVQYHLWGLNAWGWHLGNIIFHTLNSILAFLIFSLLFKGSGKNGIEKRPAGEFPASTFALMAALIFAAHPVKTEAVAWITASSELLPALFVLLSFYLYIRSQHKGGSASYILSIAAFFIATLCKETGISLLLMIIAYDVIMRTRTVRECARRYIPFFLAGVLYFAIRIYALETMIPKATMHPYLNGFQFFINIFPLFIEQIKMLLLPIKLSAFHVFNPVYAITEMRAIGSIIITILIFFLFSILRKRERLYLLGFAIVVIPLLPALFIPALDRNPFAERYLYLPSTGFALLVALAFREALGYFSSQKKARGVGFFIRAFVILTIVYSIGTVKRNFEWKDRFTLWRSSVVKDPDNYYALNSLGRVHLGSDEFDTAIALFEASIEANSSRRHPDPHVLGNAHLSLADSFRMKGMAEEATAHYEVVIKMAPKRFDANFRAAMLYHEKGAYSLAIARYRTALEATDDKDEQTGILMNIGNIYAQKQEWTNALKLYDRALKITPGNPLILKNMAIVVEKRLKETKERNGSVK